jgi:Ca2+-binding EF-hand superfamily protein
MAFSSYDRFDPVGQKHVDRLPHKGRNSRRHGSAPFATETGPATPSKADLQRGLSELGIKISPQQLDKLRSMGGAEVLKSIVTLGSGKDGAPPPAPSSRASQSATAPTRTQTGQTAHKNQSSVTGLLRMPVAEANRIVSSGDDIRDRDRVVTGLQSDRHRHFEHRQMGRKKTELHALRSLKACGPDPATVYKKLLQKNENGSKDILSKDGLRRGLTELAGVQLSPADLDAVVHKLDPKMSGKEGITLRQFSQILTKLPDNHRAKTSRQERQHHIDTINLTNRRAVDPVQVEVNSRAAVLAGIDAKLSKRFGTEPDRLRRLYMAMERNGDGTISASNLQNGMNRLGMSVSKDEFKTLMVTVQNVQRSVNAPPSGDDIYFSDLVHAFEREISPMDSQDFASLDFSNDHPRYNEPTDDHKRGYIHDEVTGLPSQMVHVEHHKKNNAFDELPQGKDKSKFRPTPHTSEYRKSIRLKSQLLAKLEEKGRSVADAFIALDSDRDGLVTNSDMRRGLMMNLGVQLSKTDLQCLVDHTVERENGITYQEFAHALQRDDKYHGYANDAKGSGGGGILEGPIAAAVGIDAVKHWTGRKEHRGQLSSAMTAKGTVSIGAQYADPHGVGVVGGNTSALEASATKAKQQQAGKQERRGNLIAARVGEHIRQRAHHVSDTFLDMDLQQHGSLSYVELRQGLDRIGVHLENDDFGLLINQLDKNGDGRVEFDEFARLVTVFVCCCYM